MFRSLPLFLNGLLLLAVLGSAACSHCEETFVVPEDAQYWCTGDTESQPTAFINYCDDGEDPFSGCSPQDRCNYEDELGSACAYCLPRTTVKVWIENNCEKNCWIEEISPKHAGLEIGDTFYIKCR